MANCDTTVIEVGSCTTGNVVNNENGTHTFYPGDGTSITFPTLYLGSVTFNTTTRVLTLTMSEGTDYTVTIPPAPDITNNLDNTYTITYPDGTEFDIDTNDVVTAIVNNGDGTIIYTDEDGIETNIDICDILQYCEINSFGNVNAAPDASNVFLVYNSGTGEWEEGKANFVTISDQTGSIYDHGSLPGAPSAPPANPNINDVIIEVFANGQIYWVWAGATWNRYYESYPTQSPTFTGTASLNAGVVTNDFQVSGDLIVDAIRPDIDGTAAIVIADQSGIPFLTFNTNGQKILYTGMGSDGGISLGNTGVHSNLEDAIIIGKNAAAGTSQFYDGVVTTESGAVIIGREAAFNSQINNYLVAIGRSAYANSTANSSNSVYIGSSVGADVTDISAENIVAIGHNAGRTATELSDATVIGYSAGYANAGANVVIVGRSAGNNNTGANITLIGRSAGNNNTGSSVVGVGYQALESNTENYAVGVGYQALDGNVGNYNIGVGYQALKNNLDAIGLNIAIGANALEGSNTRQTVAFGYNSGTGYTGTGGTLLGYQTGNGATGGNYNIFVGYNAGASATAESMIVIGQNKGQSNAIDGLLDIGAYDGISIISGLMNALESSQTLTLHADTTVEYSLNVTEDFAVATDLFVVDTTNELITIDASNGSGDNMMELTSSYANVRIQGAGASALRLERNQNGNDAYSIEFIKRRGSIGAPADIVQGDYLGRIKFGARYSGGVEAEFAVIEGVSGTGGNREGIITFKTSNGGGPVEHVRIDEFGLTTLSTNTINFANTMGNSTLDPTTDAPADWLEVQIAGTTYYVPVYAAS